ncbi:MAG: GTP 3',8-cyclase MoaA, partial [Candidatus Omnitrophica bacterium]|nr:GTP 3',8-cyclase MoaA [Candidatus Omnitrophota bacterium]
EETYSQHYQFLKKEEWLTFDEIIRLVRAFTQLGVKKVRLTGGEPLLRPDLPELIKELSQISDIEDLALTTNGMLLKEFAAQLKQAGLKRLNLSLDTLDSRVFHLMNGHRGSVDDVLDGLKAAEAVGFQSVKINVVVQRGVNDNTIMDMVRYFRNTGHVLRFIEYMDVGTCNDWRYEYVVPSQEIINMIQRAFPLEPVGPNYSGEVAARYRLKDGSGEIGMVSSVSQPFCQDCTRARLSADGKFYTCLFAKEGVSLKEYASAGYSDEELTHYIQSIWHKREDRYSEIRSVNKEAKTERERVEMFNIGG